MDKVIIPLFVRPFLWSYDTSSMDLEVDKVRIITNVLNLGDERAVDWLFKVYDSAQIKAVINQPRPGEWDKKSLNFWSLIFGLSVAYPLTRPI